MCPQTTLSFRMRRCKVICFFIFLFFSVRRTDALYNGNPSFPMMPEQGIFFTHSSLALKGGYAYDAVFNRKLETQTNQRHEKKTIKQFTSRDQFGVLTLNFADRVELYGDLGSMSTTLFQHPFKDTKIHYRTDTDFAWSIGGRTLFAYWGNVQFGLAASYLHSSPALESIKVNGGTVSHKNAQMRYSEWQVGAGISYHVWMLFPYIGVKYADVRAKFFHLAGLQSFFPKESFRIKSTKQLGIILGLGLAPEKGFDLNIEGRFIDETALTVSADIRF